MMWNQEFSAIRGEYKKIGLKFQKAAQIGRKQQHLPEGLWSALTHAKLFENGLSYQNQDGLFYLAAALEGLCYGILDGGTSTALMAHLGLGLHTLNAFCHPKIKQHYMDLVLNKNNIISFAVTEPHGGSNPQKLETRLIEANKGYLLNGKKWQISNAPFADLILVMCREEKTLEPACVLIEANWSGVDRSKLLFQLGPKSSPAAEIIFNNVLVPKTHVLGKIGDGINILNNAFLRERLLVAFSCIGSTGRIFDIVMEHAQKRCVFDNPISSNQYIRKHLTDIIINIETSKAIAHQGLAAFRENKDASYLASICKHYSTDRATNSCIKAIKIMGSYGLLEDTIGEHLMTAVSATIAGGTEEMQREEIYHWLYRRYRRNIRANKHE